MDKCTILCYLCINRKDMVQFLYKNCSMLNWLHIVFTKLPTTQSALQHMSSSAIHTYIHTLMTDFAMHGSYLLIRSKRALLSSALQYFCTHLFRKTLTHHWNGHQEQFVVWCLTQSPLTCRLVKPGDWSTTTALSPTNYIDVNLFLNIITTQSAWTYRPN